LRLAGDQPGLHFFDGFESTTDCQDFVQLDLCGCDQLRGASLDDMGAVQDVGVVEQVGLVSEDPLDSLRPLLVPGVGEAQGLIPGW
jgi:hypothetical protein